MSALNYDRDDERFGPGTAYSEPTRGFNGLFKIPIAIAVLFGLAAVGWVIWIAYDEGVRTGAVKTVPLIRAEASDLKRKPDDPGGLVVPHQDKLVFNRLAPGQADEPVERLLPLPEAPVALPVAVTSAPPPVKSIGSGPLTAETEIAQALTPNLVDPGPRSKMPPQAANAPPPPPAPPIDPAEIVAKTPPAAATPLKLPAELTKKLPASSAAQVAPPPAVEKPPVEKSPQIAAAAAWRIQLFSLSSQKDAETVWARLQKSNRDLLGGLELRVQTAKLPKGIFYRVQAGPLPNRDAAASLCGTLKSRKQDCLVVAPKR